MQITPISYNVENNSIQASSNSFGLGHRKPAYYSKKDKEQYGNTIPKEVNIPNTESFMNYATELLKDGKIILNEEFGFIAFKNLIYLR